MHDRPGIGSELLLGESLDARRGDTAVARDVLRQVVRRAEVVVVHVQAVGDAAKPTERFESLDGSGIDDVPGALDLGRVWSCVAKVTQFGIDRLLELIRRMARPCGGLNLEDRTEHQTLLPCGDVLRDLLLVHKRLVQTAGLAAA